MRRKLPAQVLFNMKSLSKSSSGTLSIMTLITIKKLSESMKSQLLKNKMVFTKARNLPSYLANNRNEENNFEL